MRRQIEEKRKAAEKQRKEAEKLESEKIDPEKIKNEVPQVVSFSIFKEKKQLCCFIIIHCCEKLHISLYHQISFYQNSKSYLIFYNQVINKIKITLLEFRI